MNAIDRRELLIAGLAGFGTAALGAGRTAAGADIRAEDTHSFHHDHIIGTSLDLHVAGCDEAAAREAERAALEEIERLRRVLSTYDPASELSHLNRSLGPIPASPDLAAVLRAYEHWHRSTGGAFNGQLGELAQLWRQAEATGQLPSPAGLQHSARELAPPGWRLDSLAGTVHRTSDRRLDLNALGKAYIIDQVVGAVRSRVPEMTGLLVNLGGDIVAWGAQPGSAGWAVGIQDPLRHHDNAPPLAGLRLVNRAVASSGGYQRFYTVGGERYSHVLDPRTGWPATGVAGATVVAADCVTANALATALCVLSPAEGLRLVATVPGAGCLIVAADGTRVRSPGLELFEVTPVRGLIRDDSKDPKPADPKPADPWPDGFQVAVTVELPKLDAKRYRKPYTAVWVEDDKGHPVRTLAVWGNAPKYLKDLSDWWKIGKDDSALVKAIARATRGPGKYDLVWDGKDDKGNALTQGMYTVRVEVHREFGAHLRQSGKIDCRDKPASVKLEKNDETAETVVEFKMVEKKK